MAVRDVKYSNGVATAKPNTIATLRAQCVIDIAAAQAKTTSDASAEIDTLDLSYTALAAALDITYATGGVVVEVDMAAVTTKTQLRAALDAVFEHYTSRSNLITAD